MTMDIRRIEELLSITFDNKCYLEAAFNHPSYANANNTRSNQRLEFLGDSIVNFVVAEYLCVKYDKQQEGFLTKIRAKIVSKEGLALAVQKLGVVSFLRIGNGQEYVRNSHAVMCDLFEAIVGAVYLDKGMEVTRNFVLNALSDTFTTVTAEINDDHKSLLLELGAKNGWKIEFVLVRKEGLSHAPVFYIDVLCNGECVGQASAGNKKVAEQYAAHEALLRLARND